MTYKQAVDYIHSLEKFGIKPGLDRIRTLCEALGNPQDNLRFIHIAGTNGKGSTSTFCSEILVKAGFKTGLFTSPYVTDFRERICLNGEMIPENDLARYTGEVKDAIEKTGLLITEFEAITAVAFLYFSAVKCDIAVLEVGLGGRFDATNIIKPPLVAGIVSISLDHMNVLGNTVSEIAFEKCGIIKPGSKVVSYPLQTDEAYGVIAAQSEKNGCRLIVPDIRSLNIDEINSSFSRFTYKGEEYRINLPGEHMIYNGVTAVEIIGALGEKIKEDSVREGLASTAMPARMEKISENPDIIIDGGHNAACAVALKRCLDGNYRGRDIIMVCSIMEDKDYNTYLKTVAPAAKIFIATKANISRALSSDKLCRAAEKFCGKCFDVPSPSDAVKKALSLAGKKDVIVICGSFYLAGDIRAELTERGEKMIKDIKSGVYPTMLTPFTEDKKIDYDAVLRLLQWYAEKKVDGVFAICQSSEIFYLSFEERLELLKFVMKNLPDGIDVVASGHTADSVDRQIYEASAFIETGIDAYVFISNRFAAETDDDTVFLRNYEKAVKSIPETGLGIYECPYPYKRIMMPDTLKKCCEISNLKFIKDTCCDIDLIKKKLEATKGTGLKIFNANAATLYESLIAGCAGYSGVMANFHPELYSRLCKNYLTEPEKAEQLANCLSLMSTIELQQYPVNAKYHLNLIGCEMTSVCRSRDNSTFTQGNMKEIKAMVEVEKMIKNRFGID